MSPCYLCLSVSLPVCLSVICLSLSLAVKCIGYFITTGYGGQVHPCTAIEVCVCTIGVNVCAIVLDGSRVIGNAVQ